MNLLDILSLVLVLILSIGIEGTEVRLGAIHVRFTSARLRQSLYNESITDETVVNNGTPVSFVCLSTSKGIRWHLPENVEGGLDYNITEVDIPTDEPWAPTVQSTLRLFSARNIHAGLYGCACSDMSRQHLVRASQALGKVHARKHQLYVNDPTRLFSNKKRLGMMPPVITAMENGLADFDCQPASPDVVTKLYHFSPLGRVEVKTEFLPGVGFRINITSALFSQGMYFCVATLGPRREQLMYNVHIAASNPNAMSHPRFKSKNRQFNFIRGQSLSFKCMVVFHVGMPVEVKWTKDGSPLVNSTRVKVTPAEYAPLCAHGRTDCARIKEFDRIQNRRIITRVMIRHVKVQDAGTYQCMSSTFGLTKSRTRQVKVTEKVSEGDLQVLDLV